VTDAWVPPKNPLSTLSHTLAERYHCELREADVRAFNLSSISFELRARIAGLHGWDRTIARNKWFQKTAVSELDQTAIVGSPCTLFAYSYAAREIFLYARSRGWRTVLGQIDPGPVEEQIVTMLYAGNLTQQRKWEPAPPSYWAQWRDECELADRIVVNSAWAQRALEQEGVPRAKLFIVPLAYERPAEAKLVKREYPVCFSQQRRLRVLFLGQINLRKGCGLLLDAVRQLRGEPVEFWFVGPKQIVVPEDLMGRSEVRWFGPVTRSQTAKFYREADLFVLPTFSDGFGLTQLEAQAWKLPILASRFCGEVVEDGRNGKLLTAVTAVEIVDAIREYLANPHRLHCLSTKAALGEKFKFARIGDLFLGSLN
jgi:glycosyltransferase involved in cell wall biosynthesis